MGPCFGFFIPCVVFELQSFSLSQKVLAVGLEQNQVIFLVPVTYGKNSFENNLNNLMHLHLIKLCNI
jgi:hypothetical protein